MKNVKSEKIYEWIFRLTEYFIKEKLLFYGIDHGLFSQNMIDTEFKLVASIMKKDDNMYNSLLGRVKKFFPNTFRIVVLGVGWSTTNKLQAMDVYTCDDLQKVSLEALQKEFGPKTGQSLYRYCRGQDDRPIRVERERKSVSAEINYGIRFTQVLKTDWCYISISINDSLR